MKMMLMLSRTWRFLGVRRVRTRWKPAKRSCCFFRFAFRKLTIEQRRLHRRTITEHHINTGFLCRLLLLLDDKVVKNPSRYWNCQRNSLHSTVVLTLGSCNDCSQFPSSSALLDVSPHPQTAALKVSHCDVAKKKSSGMPIFLGLLCALPEYQK